MGNRNICKWCKEPYSGAPVCPSSWGIFKKEAVAHCSPGSGGLLSKCYCSEKCRAEAEGDSGGGKSESAREEEYESEGGSTSSSSGSGGMGVVGNVIGGVVLILLLIVVIGIIFSKNEDANDPAVKMAKWEEHLEKRRAAFAEGLSEEGVEARGLKNYTWEEWQARSQKGQAKASEKPAEKVEDVVEKYREHMQKRMSLLNGGLNDKILHEMGYDDYTLDAFKQNYKNIKYKTLEEIKHGFATPDSSVAAPEKPATQADVVPEKPTVKPTKPIAKPDKPMTKPAKPVAPTAVAPAKPKVAPAKPTAPKVEQPKDGAESQDGAKASASKDSKGIAITVEGKGKTKDAAVRSAIRRAVFRTVGTWVGSKSRMEENRDAVNAQMATVTEDDIRKYEVLETTQQDGGFVLKVKVHVSKKKLAAKFAKIFPDVFGND